LIAVAGCGASQHAAAPGGDRYLITAKRVYTAPDAPPLDDAWVEVAGGTIVAVGNGAAPEGVRRDDTCSGGVIAAGFQNSHVHFIAESFGGAGQKPAAALQPPLTERSSISSTSLLVDPVALGRGLPLFAHDGV